MKIVHMTSAHPRYDTRIFLKECKTLAASGYDTHLVVADGVADEYRDGVRIWGVPKKGTRLARIFGSPRQVVDKGIELAADVYHLHDPELLPMAARLKRMGKHVVFDAHEDVAKQILGKPYLPSWSRRIVSSVYSLVESLYLPYVDLLITATTAIAERLKSNTRNCVVVNNYPLLGELTAGSGYGNREKAICYLGALSEIRGARELVTAMAMLHTDARLLFAGDFSPPSLGEEIRKMDGWDRVVEMGHLDRHEVRKMLDRARAGVVTFLPAPNHIESQPNKIFEYMSAGLPVIGSNFELWREIIEGGEAGICVDPKDPASIASAIDRVIQEEALAAKMGERGAIAVTTRFNWSTESLKLLNAYASLLT